MRHLLLAILFVATLLATSAAVADEAAQTSSPEFHISGVPSVSLKLSEGYGIVIKDGVHPGGVSTKLDIVVSWKFAAWFAFGTGVGMSTPNDLFKPALRFTPTATFLLPEKFSLSLGFLYQYNPAYGNKPATNVVGPSIGLGYFLTDHVSIGLSIGPGRAVEDDQPWTLVDTIGISYRF